MRRALLDAQFHGTYYFASVVGNIVRDPIVYIRKLDDFYGDDRYLNYVRPFPRDSAFHWFICFVVDALVFEEIDEVDLEDRKRQFATFQNMPEALASLKPTVLPIDEAMSAYGIGTITFADWLSASGKTFGTANENDVYEYYEETRQSAHYETLVDRWTAEVFFVTFQNRQLLLDFNEMMAGQVSDGHLEDIPEEFRVHYSQEGMLKRVAVPVWVQRAVFYRDRGLCSLCQRDLSGILAIGNVENYDHIVPLARGGLNDVTNIQLLCRECNAAKRDGIPQTSGRYEQWYDPSMGDDDRSG
jgi:hypothetical protein